MDFIEIFNKFADLQKIVGLYIANPESSSFNEMLDRIYGDLIQIPAKTLQKRSVEILPIIETLKKDVPNYFNEERRNEIDRKNKIVKKASAAERILPEKISRKKDVIKYSNQEIKDLKRQITKLEKEKRKYSDNISKIRRKISKATSEKTRNIRELEEKLNKYEEKFAKLNDKIREKLNEVKNITNKIKTAENSINTLEGRLEKKAGKVTKNKNEVEKLEKELENLQRNITAKFQQIQEILSKSVLEANSNKFEQELQANLKQELQRNNKRAIWLQILIAMLLGVTIIFFYKTFSGLQNFPDIMIEVQKHNSTGNDTIGVQIYCTRDTTLQTKLNYNTNIISDDNVKVVTYIPEQKVVLTFDFWGKLLYLSPFFIIFIWLIRKSRTISTFYNKIIQRQSSILEMLPLINMTELEKRADIIEEVIEKVFLDDQK